MFSSPLLKNYFTCALTLHVQQVLPTVSRSPASSLVRGPAHLKTEVCSKCSVSVITGPDIFFNFFFFLRKTKKPHLITPLNLYFQLSRVHFNLPFRAESSLPSSLGSPGFCVVLSLPDWDEPGKQITLLGSGPVLVFARFALVWKSSSTSWVPAPWLRGDHLSGVHLVWFGHKQLAPLPSHHSRLACPRAGSGFYEGGWSNTPWLEGSCRWGKSPPAIPLLLVLCFGDLN